MKELILILIGGAFMTRLIIYIYYERILRIAYNVANSNHELVKQIKLRYTNCNALDIPISNISAFIKKHILINCGFKNVVPIIDTSGYIMCGVAITTIYIYYRSNTIYIPMVIMIFLLLNNIIKGEEKLNIATTIIADHLENVLAHRNINKREKMAARKLREENNEKKADAVQKELVMQKMSDEQKEPEIQKMSDEQKEHVMQKNVEKNVTDMSSKNTLLENSLGNLIHQAVDAKHAERIINDVLKEFLVE